MIARAAPFLSALLALGLAVSAFAHGYAQARAPASEAHELVICGETGLEIILVDAAGELIDPDACADSLCHDCLRVIAALSTGIATAPPHALASALTAPRRAAPALPAMTRMAHRPRAPPLPTQA